MAHRAPALHGRSVQRRAIHVAHRCTSAVWILDLAALKKLDNVVIEAINLEEVPRRGSDHGPVRHPTLTALLPLGAPHAAAQADITDVGLANFSGLPKMHEMNLKGCKGITDEGIATLTRNNPVRGARGRWLSRRTLIHPRTYAQALFSLDLRETNVTDRCIPYLSQMQMLHSLNLFRTPVTKDAVARLQEALPKCKITV